MASCIKLRQYVTRVMIGL